MRATHLAPLFLVAAIAACADEAVKATAMLGPTTGNSLTGLASFEQSGDKVELTLSVESAMPGEHGVHIHEMASCDPDGNKYFGHWNPGMAGTHGLAGDASSHAGDVGNVVVGPNGRGGLTTPFRTDRWTIGTGMPNDVVGKVIVVHERRDDLMSQPTGNVGPGIGCGVIRLPAKKE